MERDATLEEFLDSGEREPPETASGGPTDEKRDDADMATSTMSYRPGGGACAVCGTAVERRWRDDNGLVCRDCKTW